MGLKPYDNLVLAHANLIHYWPLDGALTDLKGGNDLVGTNGWTNGPIGSQAALLNGIDQQLQSTANIGLTGTNNVTLEMMIQWIVYDLANAEVQAEFTPTINAFPDGFAVLTEGDIATDPLSVGLRGNVGYSSYRYNKASTGITQLYWYHIIAIFNKSLATNEVSVYMDGRLLTANSVPFNSNNTNAFGNNKLYLASRAGTSLYSNIAIANVALFNTALTASEIMSHAQLAIPRRRRWHR